MTCLLRRAKRRWRVQRVLNTKMESLKGDLCDPLHSRLPFRESNACQANVLVMAGISSPRLLQEVASRRLGCFLHERFSCLTAMSCKLTANHRRSWPFMATSCLSCLPTMAPCNSVFNFHVSKSYAFWAYVKQASVQHNDSSKQDVVGCRAVRPISSCHYVCN